MSYSKKKKKTHNYTPFPQTLLVLSCQIPRCCFSIGPWCTFFEQRTCHWKNVASQVTHANTPESGGTCGPLLRILLTAEHKSLERHVSKHRS